MDHNVSTRSNPVVVEGGVCGQQGMLHACGGGGGNKWLVYERRVRCACAFVHSFMRTPIRSYPATALPTIMFCNYRVTHLVDENLPLT